MRFADDVLPFSTSLSQLNKMMSDFKKKPTEQVELKIHREKTNILYSQRPNSETEATIDDITVEILPLHGKAKYLGTKPFRPSSKGRRT